VNYSHLKIIVVFLDDDYLFVYLFVILRDKRTQAII
jgi:hypothetical protein